ncbi:MAG: PhzF family phenazine biosynthesis protein [Planctomycetia bacterium]
MEQIRCWQIDSFAARKFTGNPAAVCLLRDEADPAWMQAVAAEMNLAETSFVRPAADGFALRWFTPTIEVDLCGHATLAAAHALWESNAAPADEPLRFHTRSGVLTCVKKDDLIELDFPTVPVAPADLDPRLPPALGLDRVDFSGATKVDRFLEVADPAVLRSLRPDFRALAAVPTRGVIVTAPSDDPRYDFLSRFFAPLSGIDEDPATGSAHCSLAPYWGAKTGKVELVGFQASARGAEVRMNWDADRTRLTGGAVTVWRGEMA